MISSDIYAVLQWWIVLYFIGIAFLPLASLFFSHFYDRGYLFSKILGIAITSYCVFILGILHLVPFGQISAIIISLVAAVLCYIPIRREHSLIDMFKKSWRIFFWEEVFFLVALFSWCYVHSFNPDIHGLEKYMDFGFINSILRSEYFPPKDMWFPPNSINYYYYGHFITAFLTKISGVAPALTFNIMLSTVFAWCLTESFSIGSNLFLFTQKKLSSFKSKYKLVMSGILTALLLTLGGNLHIIYGFFSPYQVDNPKPFWELPFLPKSFPNSYWYPNATRYIFHTIHEFPIYSWVVADLHGHVLDIPFVLFIIAFLLEIFVNVESEHIYKIRDFLFSSQQHKLYLIFNPRSILLLGFILAIMYMTNAWDGAIYLLLTGFVSFYLLWEYTQDVKTNIKNQTAQIKKKVKKNSNKILSSLLLLLGRFMLTMSIIAIVFLIFTFPYNHFFKPFASGVGVLCSPSFLAKIGRIGPFLFEADHCQHSFWWELVTLYGFFYFFVFSFFVFLALSKKIFRSDAFILLLILLSTLLIFLPEFIYLKDIYPAHYRANTMFKLCFQAFMMLSVCSGYIFVRIIQNSRKITYFTFFPVSVILIVLVLTYPYLAIPSYYGDLKNIKSLDGMVYLKTLYPSDYQGILWLNKNIKGQPVILEAQGDSYTDYERVSANTGFPTVLGWTVHEWLWRGDYGIPAPRITEVKDIYESKNLDKTKELLKKYQVKYVFIGTMEYQKYPNLNENKFKVLGKVVFSDGKTKIFKLKYY